MSLNFYMATKNKQIAKEYFKEYVLTEHFAPYIGYEIHIAKVSAGWQPLFQANGKLQSVATLKELYEGGEVIIYDEYDEEYSWEKFSNKIQHTSNGAWHEYAVDPQGYEFTWSDFV